MALEDDRKRALHDVLSRADFRLEQKQPSR
jgi:hypothetical protein